MKSYSMRYIRYTETLHIPTHISCKNYNYLSRHLNDKILKLNYSKQAYLQFTNMLAVCRVEGGRWVGYL